MESPLLEELSRKLAELVQRQGQFQQEITALQRTLEELRRKESTTKVHVEDNKIKGPETPPVTIPKLETVKVPDQASTTPPVNRPPGGMGRNEKAGNGPIEEFIGTNLLNKIGIAILVIGIGIGARYAIDHDLIRPLTRVILGYFCGIILVVMAIRLKPKYQNFSAVLLSGGMAVLYFITYAAYDLYSLLPQLLAFILMVVFTAFTVFAALQYNQQVIAIIGLVGAYGVPFLLSNNSGRVAVLFSYVTVINLGILVLAFRKYWKQLYYVAFALTWLIFATWYFGRYNPADHLWIELVFSTFFFATFYVTLLAYRLIRGESLDALDIVLLLLNSFFYFGFGYHAVDLHPQGEMFLGLFTILNALLHFLAGVIILKNREQSRDIFLFVAGLVLLFLTLSVPVQLEGHWVTIIWAGEAALLFWIGRTKGLVPYERISYPLVLLAFLSLLQDWSGFYGHYVKSDPETWVRPFLNIQPLSSLMVAVAFGLIIRISRDKQFKAPDKLQSLGNLLLIGVPALLLVTLYFSLFLEVGNSWSQRLVDSELSVKVGDENSFYTNDDLLKFKSLWLLNYSAIFVFALALINIRWIKNKLLIEVVVAFSALVTLGFITSGLTDLRVLLMSYIHQINAEYYYRGGGYIAFRYICIAMMAPLLWINLRFTQGGEFGEAIRKAERIFLHVVIIALLSTEFLSAFALLDISNSDKLMLSILWGAYALGLIVYGLIRDYQFLRITGIALFGITLLKLFFYDLAGMGTIAKTLVMIILGILLLTASFLYNRFKKPNHVDQQN